MKSPQQELGTIVTGLKNRINRPYDTIAHINMVQDRMKLHQKLSYLDKYGLVQGITISKPFGVDGRMLTVERKHTVYGCPRTKTFSNIAPYREQLRQGILLLSDWAGVDPRQFTETINLTIDYYEIIMSRRAGKL